MRFSADKKELEEVDCKPLCVDKSEKFADASVNRNFVKDKVMKVLLGNIKQQEILLVLTSAKEVIGIDLAQMKSLFIVQCKRKFIGY